MNRDRYLEIVEEEEGDFSYLSESEREVFIDKHQFALFELHRKYHRGEIDLQPISHRGGGVWKIHKKSKLIESVFMNLPIPSIYLAEVEEGRYEVIDGQHRLGAFFEFFDDRFKLHGLPVLHQLNGLSFSSMDRKFQRRMEDYQVHVFLIRKESHPDVRFDIFLRINEGATQLNAQEIRSYLFRGLGMDFIRWLAEDDYFLRLTRRKLRRGRLKDQEAVLRFLAFYRNGFTGYFGNLDAFLNKTLQDLDRKTTDDEFRNLEDVFRSTMKLVYEVFGEDAFMNPRARRQSFNFYLFDILSNSFTEHDRETILHHREQVKRAWFDMVAHNREFQRLVTANNMSTRNVMFGYHLWNFELDAWLHGGREIDDPTI